MCVCGGGGGGGGGGVHFNVIRLRKERNIEGRITRPMKRFSQIVDELELRDLTL